MMADMNHTTDTEVAAALDELHAIARDDRGAILTWLAGYDPDTFVQVMQASAGFRARHLTKAVPA